MIRGVIKLQPEEEVIGVVRRSLLPELYRFLFALVWILAPFFFFFPLIGAGAFGVLLFITIVALGGVYLYRQWQAWRNMYLIVTNKRVVDVDQPGIVKREISELVLEEVSNVSVHFDGWLSKAFGLGTVRVETTEAQTFDLELGGVRDPARVKELILEVKSMGKTA